MLLELVARSTKVFEARSAEEREAVFKLRYSIYGQELRRDYPGMDHERRVLRQPEDDAPETRIYFAGPAHAPTGTVRARIWDEPPADVVEELSLRRLPKARIAYLERMMVRPTLRGRLLVPALLWHGYEHLMREGVELCVLTCVPGLVRHYVKFGARTYGAKPVEGASTAEIPLLIVMNDPAHLKTMGSFMHPQMRRLARKYDARALEPLFAPEAQPVVVDPRRVAAEMAEARCALFDGIAAGALRQLSERAFVLEVGAGELVVRQGTAEREMYVLLSGDLQVEGRDARLGPGQPVGEIGFLGTEGVRTATVRALAKSRLLVLRRRFLDDLADKDPDAAYKLSRNLSRILADRFTQLGQSL
jgi:hypothetical protein